MIDSMYKDEIVEHYKDPQNFGSLDNFTASSKQTNPFCGDQVEIFVKIENDHVQDIRFMGDGCAISIAAASILTEYVKGKTIHELQLFSEHTMLELLGIDISETRKKCALLAYATFKDCLAI